MAAQRSLHDLERSGLPQTITERTQKDRLYNDLIQFSKELGLKWRDPTSVGASFLKKLTNILWYIDGHYDVIGDRSNKIPDAFSQFNGYNRPQASKHRKCTKENLKREEISTHVLTLQEVIHASWMQKDIFAPLRQSVIELGDSLSGYAAYMQTKSKYQRLHHMMEVPAANPTDNSTVRFLAKRTEVSRCLKPLNDAIQSKCTYQPVFIGDFAPSNRRQ